LTPLPLLAAALSAAPVNSIVRHPLAIFLHIVGTGHHNQFGCGAKPFGGRSCTHAAAKAFESYLTNLAKTIGAKGITEELNNQALSEVDATISIPQQVARSLSLPHAFCEPDRSERETLGIKDENNIRGWAFLNNALESTIQCQIARHVRKREQEWCRRILQLSCSPILHICGRDHISTFPSIARCYGMEVQIVHPDWDA